MTQRVVIQILAIMLLTPLASAGGGSTLAAPPLKPPLCDGVPATIFGRSGTIKGTNGPDVIVGSAQSDLIAGRGGADRICGGDGNDTIDGGPDNDRLFGEGDDDIVLGGPGNDTLADYATPGFGCLSNGPGSTICFGGQRLDGGDGADTIAGIGFLLGGGGADDLTLYFGDADGGHGNDVLRPDTTSTGDDGPLFRGGSGNDVIDGDKGIDFGLTEILGGTGFDACFSDANDVEFSCEF